MKCAEWTGVWTTTMKNGVSHIRTANMTNMKHRCVRCGAQFKNTTDNYLVRGNYCGEEDCKPKYVLPHGEYTNLHRVVAYPDEF